MSQVELLQLLHTKHVEFASEFSAWLTNSSRFVEFIGSYGPKIKKKINRLSTKEDLEDIFWELRCAYLFIQCDCFPQIKYEAYGGQGPDLAITHISGLEFNVEAKRIRQTEFDARFDAWESNISKQICRSLSQCFIWISITTLNESDWSKLIERLEDGSGKIVDYCLDLLHQSEVTLPVDETLSRWIPGFENEVEVSISKVSERIPPKNASYRVVVLQPIFYTQKEYAKFGDLICSSIRQMKPGMINILAISSTSGNHEELDLSRAIQSLTELIAQRNEQFFVDKGFESLDDFLVQLARLSGILFRDVIVRSPKERKILWRSELADHKIPRELERNLLEIYS